MFFIIKKDTCDFKEFVFKINSKIQKEGFPFKQLGFPESRILDKAILPDKEGMVIVLKRLVW